MPTTIAEATTLLSQLGEVAKAEFADEGIQRSLGVPPPVLVTYKMYDSRREPVRVSDLLISVCIFHSFSNTRGSTLLRTKPI